MSKPRTNDGRGHPATTQDYEYTDDEAEFIRAVAEFRRRTGRSCPSCCDLLAVAKSLGYRKPEKEG